MVGFYDVNAGSAPSGLAALVDPAYSEIGDSLRRRFFPTESDKKEAELLEKLQQAKIQGQIFETDQKGVDLDKSRAELEKFKALKDIEMLARDSNSLLEIKDPVRLKQKLIERAQYYAQNPLETDPNVANEILNLANRITDEDSFNAVRSEISAELRQAQDLVEANKSRFISEEKRIEEERLSDKQEFDKKSKLVDQEIDRQRVAVSAQNAAATNNLARAQFAFAKQNAIFNQNIALGNQQLKQQTQKFHEQIKRMEVDQKKREEIEKSVDKYMQLKSGYELSDQTIINIDKALSNKKGLERTSGVWRLVPNLPGSDAADLDATIQSIASGEFLEGVNNTNLKGSLSDKEGEKVSMIRSVIADKNISLERKVQELNELKSLLEKSKSRLLIRQATVRRSIPDDVLGVEKSAPAAVYDENGDRINND